MLFVSYIQDERTTITFCLFIKTIKLIVNSVAIRKDYNNTKAVFRFNYFIQTVNFLKQSEKQNMNFLFIQNTNIINLLINSILKYSILENLGYHYSKQMIIQFQYPSNSLLSIFYKRNENQSK